MVPSILKFFFFLQKKNNRSLSFFWAIFRGNGAKNSYISDPHISHTFDEVEDRSRSDHSGPSYQPSWVGDIFQKVWRGTVSESWTSNCSNFTTTGSYSCRFHSRHNDDQYLAIRVICRHHQDNTSSIWEAVEFYGGSENGNGSLQFPFETWEKNILKIENLILTEYWGPVILKYSTELKNLLWNPM